MSILETIADELARDALALEEETGDLNLVDQIAKHIGTSSPTVEEAFRTAIRMRRAEQSAKRLIEKLRGVTSPRPMPGANLPARRDAAERKT